MTREQCLHAFWSSFGWKAYDETSVPDINNLPDDAKYNRITYEVAVGEFGTPVSLTGSLWERSTSWAGVTSKAEQIYAYIGRGGRILHYDGGALWIRRGSPWAQRMGDSDDMMRRIVLNVEVEFIE